jgi:hypothetical protein
MKYQEWKLNPRKFLALTGYTIDAFDALVPYFESAHDEYLCVFDITGKRRKQKLNRVTIYPNSPLPGIKERLLFVLSYKKLNPIQYAHAELFGMTQKDCCYYFHGLSTILDLALEKHGSLPTDNPEVLEKELISIATDAESDKNVFHDGTEREVPRPVDDELQQAAYSGKKKKHTVKNAVVMTACCLILFVSKTVTGNVHDKKIADGYKIPAGIKLWQDTGYAGYRPKDVLIYEPKKKPRGGELTREEKEYNRNISRCRVRVEHAIGSVKRCRIVKDECRLRRGKYVEKSFRTCAGLHNFRIKHNPFKYGEIKS